VVALAGVSMVACGGLSGFLFSDSDNDGVRWITDACPEAPEDQNPPNVDDGCPDSDGDGFANSVDRCPDLIGEDGTEPGCPPDQDGDGFRDAPGLDRCVDLAEDGNSPNPKDGCPDTDSDGLIDPDDQCPDLPGSGDGAGVGCPPDSDKDGVVDPLDNCPDSSEDGNSPHADDGCPDKDSDGFSDEDDVCPDAAGQPNAVRSGCPPDVDGDGLVDGVDECPDAAEDVDGDRDSDGCPDVASSVTFINNSSFTIYYLYMSPTTQDTWGRDHLGDEVLSAYGDRFHIPSVTCNNYDIKMVDEDDDVCIIQDFRICSEVTFNFKNEHLLGCQGYR